MGLQGKWLGPQWTLPTEVPRINPVKLLSSSYYQLSGVS